jgi:hypothetical protein
MNRTKKCVLVPFEKYERMLESFHRQSDKNLDREANFVEDSSPSRITDDNLRLPTEIEPKKIPEDDILQQLSKSLRSHAKILLRIIDKNSALDWNNKGELTVDSRSVPNSHITDLLKDALVQYKNFQPAGIDEFYSHLSDIPLTLIRNPQRRALIQRGGGAYDLTNPLRAIPPPGLPDTKRRRSLIEVGKKRKKPNRSWVLKWEKL